MNKQLLEWFDGMLGSAKPEPTVEIRKILLDSWKEYFEFVNVKEAVSYTHLTLPTKRIV